MAREVVLDANVIVAWLDGADALSALSARASASGHKLRSEGADLILLDILVGEAVSVLCRRAQSDGSPPRRSNASGRFSTSSARLPGA
jgi:hypothetical protein